MASKEKATALEKELTQRFEELPLHIRIVYRQPPEGGGWYDWYTSTDGGESGTFADAIIQSVTCVQEKQGGILEAHREVHAKAERATLGTCLQRVKKARPTAVLFLHMGNAGWMTRQEALESVRLDRYLSLERDAYLIEQAEPGRPAGIYLQGADLWSYRAFDVEI